MYKFGLPTSLKAWVDRVAQANGTFRYTAQGPQSLAGQKHVLVVSTRGGMYAGTAIEAAWDHQESYLRAILGFMGVTNVRILRAEGLGMGPEAKKTAVDKAIATIAAAITT